MEPFFSIGESLKEQFPKYFGSSNCYHSLPIPRYVPWLLRRQFGIIITYLPYISWILIDFFTTCLLSENATNTKTTGTVTFCSTIFLFTFSTGKTGSIAISIIPNCILIFKHIKLVYVVGNVVIGKVIFFQLCIILEKLTSFRWYYSKARSIKGKQKKYR